MSKNTRVVILAAGKGSRMGADVPKALVPVAGRPMIDYLIDSIKKSGLEEKPIVVIGHDMEKMREYLSDRCEFAIQADQLGTGHALQCALPNLEDTDRVIVLYGDHAFVSSETIRQLAEKCQLCSSPVMLMTLDVGDFEDWRKTFYDFGRIGRNAAGEVERIIERKDANDEEKLIVEVNPGYYCFSVEWVKQNIEKLGNKNAQGEFYLTDLIGLAMSQGYPIETMTVNNPLEGIGVNSPEQLKLAEEALASVV
ncbi:TPA: hypothetical protein DEA21_02140 [Candidatus Uhrbacteria bacterium]|nr:hypothetical protein [Candidatus Uhrbacteria bacterium]HCU31191.1 hypothetical protein [Candidatus Uhrbacteria bacterium]